MKFKLEKMFHLSWKDGYVKATIQYHGKTFRYPLEKVPENALLVASYMLKEVPGFSNAGEVAEKINNTLVLLNQAMKSILPSIGENDNLYKKNIDRKITEIMFTNQSVRKRVDGSPIIQDSLVEDYRKWLYEGKGTEREKRTRTDYISTYRLLQDYEYDLGHTISYSNIDNDFIDDLIDYCYDYRKSTDEHKYLSKGGLCNRTINKRLDCLYTFIKECYVSFPAGLTKKRRENTLQKDIVRLDSSEIDMLMGLDIQEPELEWARDCLVFLCLTGLRYGDFAKLDKSYVRGNVIEMDSNKTKNECRIPLFSYAKEIGEKYNFKFQPKSNQMLNKLIKKLLVTYNLFSEPVTTKYLAKNRVVVEKPKRDYISCHTGRRSLISMLAENKVDYYRIMSISGHKSLRMLQVYIDQFSKATENEIEELDKKLFTHNEN